MNYTQLSKIADSHVNSRKVADSEWPFEEGQTVKVTVKTPAGDTFIKETKVEKLTEDGFVDKKNVYYVSEDGTFEMWPREDIEDSKKIGKPVTKVTPKKVSDSFKKFEKVIKDKYGDKVKKITEIKTAAGKMYEVVVSKENKSEFEKGRKDFKDKYEFVHSTGFGPDADKYAYYFSEKKIADSLLSLKKRIKDALEETETTEEAVACATDFLTEDSKPEEVLQAVIEVLAETIDELSEKEEKVEEVDEEITED